MRFPAVFFLLGSALAMGALPAAEPSSSAHGAAASVDPIAKTGKILFEEAMTQMPGKGWRLPNGKWSAKGDVWTATTVAADNHGPTARHDLPASDLVLELEFRFKEMKNLHVAFNDAIGHVSRVLIDPSSLQVRKDSYEHKHDTTLMRVPLKLAPNEWHKLTIQLVGNKFYASVDSSAAFGTHADLAKVKKEMALGFGKGDDTVEVRNLRISEAQPL